MIPALLVVGLVISSVGQDRETELSETAVGRFSVLDKRIAFEAAPYPVDKKVTSLVWSSPGGLVRYELSDDGEAYELTYRLGREPKECLVAMAGLKLSTSSKELFGSDALLTDSAHNCLNEEQRQVVVGEFERAMPMFATAHSEFLKQTLALHGPSYRRCIRFEFGYHGPICSTYSDEKQ